MSDDPNRLDPAFIEAEKLLSGFAMALVDADDVPELLFNAALAAAERAYRKESALCIVEQRLAGMSFI